MNTLQDQLKKFKKLALVEATLASSSGSYEQPMSFETEIEEPMEDFVGLTIADDAPQIEVVDITKKEDSKDVNIDADIDELEFDLEGSDIDINVNVTSSDDESEDVLNLMNTLGLGL
jgi:hypothetical protein|tara:strand:- start:20889 stop:21239 length:351 start_codon:yes stop_codon:yes gene_type:complete